MGEAPFGDKDVHPDWFVLEGLLAKANKDEKIRDWFVKLGAKAYMAKYMRAK